MDFQVKPFDFTHGKPGDHGGSPGFDPSHSLRRLVVSLTFVVIGINCRVRRLHCLPQFHDFGPAQCEGQDVGHLFNEGSVCSQNSEIPATEKDEPSGDVLEVLLEANLGVLVQRSAPKDALVVDPVGGDYPSSVPEGPDPREWENDESQNPTYFQKQLSGERCFYVAKVVSYRCEDVRTVIQIPNETSEADDCDGQPVDQAVQGLELLRNHCNQEDESYRAECPVEGNRICVEELIDAPQDGACGHDDPCHDPVGVPPYDDVLPPCVVVECATENAEPHEDSSQHEEWNPEDPHHHPEKVGLPEVREEDPGARLFLGHVEASFLIVELYGV